MRIAVFGDAGFTSQAALNSQLDTLHAANKSVLLVTAGRTPVDAWARAWADKNVVPWVSLDDDLDAAGISGPEARSLAAMRRGNIDTVLTASAATATATVIAAQTVATSRGHTVSKI